MIRAMHLKVDEFLDDMLFVEDMVYGTEDTRSDRFSIAPRSNSDLYWR
jgi:hypothetical protein